MCNYFNPSPKIGGDDAPPAPAIITDHQGNQIASVPSGGIFSVPASKVYQSGNLLATLAPATDYSLDTPSVISAASPTEFAAGYNNTSEPDKTKKYFHVADHVLATAVCPESVTSGIFTTDDFPTKVQFVWVDDDPNYTYNVKTVNYIVTGTLGTVTYTTTNFEVKKGEYLSIKIVEKYDNSAAASLRLRGKFAMLNFSGVIGSIEPETQAYLARAGGMDSDLLNKVNILIKGLKNKLIWPELDTFQLWAVDNTTQARQNLIGNWANAITVNSPAFYARSGVQGDGITSAVRTGFMYNRIGNLVKSKSFSTGAWFSPASSPSSDPLNATGNKDWDVMVSPNRFRAGFQFAYGDLAVNTGYWMGVAKANKIRLYKGTVLQAEMLAAGDLNATGGEIILCGQGGNTTGVINRFVGGVRIGAWWIGTEDLETKNSEMHQLLTTYFNSL